MSLKSEKKYQSDIIDWMVRNDYCLETVVFRHTAGVNASFQPGEVLEIITSKYNPLATAANAAGILMEDVNDLATATDKNVLILRRGPAIVNEDQLDVNGQTLATVVTALNALLIQTKKQPTVKTALTA